MSVPSKFQIHAWPYKGINDPNFPYSDSKGKIDLFPDGGEKISLDVPSETSGQFWIIGTFNGINGLDGFDISNTVVSEINIDDFCGTPQSVKIVDVSSMHQKVPAVNRKGRQWKHLYT